MKFRTLRRHYGDRMYEPGDEREAREDDVKHLVKAGVLEPVEGKRKAAAPENKADAPAENKTRRKAGDE